MSEIKQIPSYNKIWLDTIHMGLEQVDPKDQNIGSNELFKQAYKKTHEFAAAFEAQHHLVRCNPESELRSQTYIQRIGTNALKLVDPFIVVEISIPRGENLERFQLPLQIIGERDVTYLSTEIAYTSQGDEDEWYFGPHIFGGVTFDKKLKGCDIILPNRYYPAAVPFPQVVVSPNHQRNTLN